MKRNIDKKKWTNKKNDTKNEAKRLRAKTFDITKLEEQWSYGEQLRKVLLQHWKNKNENVYRYKVRGGKVKLLEEKIKDIFLD